MNTSVNNNPISVLIVEDETIVAAEIEIELQTMGFKVTGISYTSEDAIDTAVMHRPDVILMDIHIQGNKDGIESSLEIFHTYKPVIIFISAFNDNETKEKMAKVQPNYFLPKPISYDDLVLVIRESVGTTNQTSWTKRI